MFRTELSIPPATDQLARTARVLTLGSCFADTIGLRLAQNKVSTLANPFGTVFQPLALARLLRAAAGEEVDWQQHLLESSGRWTSYDLHSSIGANSPVELLQRIQAMVRETADFLHQTDVVLLTLGSAWAYRLRQTGELVSNCHKQPADLFVRELLTPDEIINALAETHALVRRLNPNVRFVLTVSPVRHLKETLPLNAVSKSVLRVATHVLSDLLTGVAYFPAYELLTDDLRDYRFYASDMLHPSEVAEDYIWEKFARTYFDADFGRFRKEWGAVQQALGHRPLHPGAPEHRQFVENTLGKLENLATRGVDVQAELATMRAQLAALPVPLPPVMEEEEDDEERIDIGEGTEPLSIPLSDNEPAIAASHNRPPRLSPEEFRAQRGNREGRGRRQGRHDQRTERIAAHGVAGEATPATSAPVNAELLPRRDAPAGEIPSATGNTEDALVGPMGAATPEASSEPLKKKKRRSRGGAKRTARKHALLAAELAQAQAMATTSNEAPETPAEPTPLPEAETTTQVPKKSSVIAKSVPVKRGGRRGIQSQPLYATPVPQADAATAPADEQVMTTPAAEPEIPADAAAEPAVAAAPKSRNNRRKGNKKLLPAPADAPAAGEVAASATAAGQITGVESAALAAAQVVSGSEQTRQPDRGTKDAATGGTEPQGQPESTVVPVPAPPPPRKSNRAKRALTGMRLEKPAVDTPIIPMSEENVLRTQVAAGRMTGTSANLVEAAPATQVAPKPKASRRTKATAAAPPVEPATTPAPKAAKPKKATAPKASNDAAPATAEPTKPSKPRAARKPAKPKPATPE